MKHRYESHEFRDGALAIINYADQVMAEYTAGGYDMTGRQLYYYFVAHDLFPEDRKWVRIPNTNKWRRDPKGTKNADPNYKWLLDILNMGRLAGLLDWNIMVDRTREVRTVAHWTGPGEIVEACARQFRVNSRANQDTYIEVWVEKEALAGIVVPTCAELDIYSLVCRGFVSQSAMWQGAMRFQSHDAQRGILLYLGDHDPSGIDMTRDITDRLNDTFGVEVEVVRIALTRDQIRQFNPPPDPAKPSDSRYEAYVREYGEDCWELDALDPRTLTTLIKDAVTSRTNAQRRRKLLARQEESRGQLGTIAQRLIDEPDWEPKGE